MKIIQAIKGRIALLQLKLYLIKSKEDILINIMNWDNSLLDPRTYYLDAYRYFHRLLPVEIVKHKEYFRLNKRGFGEDAFHAMWYLLYNKYKFSNFLEIGVYRGQVMSLISHIANLENNSVSIVGISPFNKSGDSVSEYPEIDYIKDIYNNFDSFSLPKPRLVNSYSTDEEAKNYIFSEIWDCIYIDGSHDYDIVKLDWENCSRNIKIGGVIVIDDSSLYTNFDNPFFAFKGHPGPSKLANEIDLSKFKEVLRVGHNRVFERLN